MLFILAKTHQATDWFNGLPLGTTHGKKYRLHSHHIFPQSVLYSASYDAGSHLDRKKVNEVANRAFLTADTNLSLSNRRPEAYLPEVQERFPEALARQFIPHDPPLWRVDRFEDFLAARRELIARKLNEYMHGLVVEPVETRERPLEETLKLGEGPTLEFKSSLEWDVVQNQRNKDLRRSVMKTVAAFLNSQGGRLVIGVDDSGGIFGLDSDLALMQLSHDRFLQHLNSLISSAIGPEYCHLIKIAIRSIDGKSVCVVDVDRASEPVFTTEASARIFYIRVGNTTRALDAAQTVSYIEQNWR
jgi:hypothetical protein